MNRLRIPLAALLLSACASVPYTGRRQMNLMSSGEENQLGEDAYKELLQKAKISTDREKLDLIRRVGRRVASAADRPDFRWEFTLIEDDKQINAFCLPGGKVAFYTGILPVTQDEDGVAVVMSHEVAHALARHGAERMSQGKLAEFGGQALSVLLAGKSIPAKEVIGEAYGLGVGVGVMLPFSRSHESEADKIGLILMAKAGYDPEQSIAFWRRMEEAAEGKGADNPLARFLSTHPSGTRRIDQIREWLPEIKSQYYKPRP
ncbi:MAG: M48 family metallopeptidase [Elusimicrobiota bacterium]